MIKMDIQDFIFEVKDEILSYEELGESKANEWEEQFLEWANAKNKGGKNKIICCINDESEIFDIADEFYYANEQNSLGEYWKNFKQDLKFE